MIVFRSIPKNKRDIIRSMENGQFKTADKDFDIRHAVGTAKYPAAKDRRRKRLENPIDGPC